MNHIEIGKLICEIISSKTLDKKLISRLNSFPNSAWEAIYKYAEPVKLLPVLFYKLKNFSEITTVPSKITHKMHKAYIASSGQTLKIQYQTKEIINILNKEGIDVIILKGAYLSEKYYQTPALRPMSDIDILVKQDDIQKAYTSLVNFGYSPSRDFKAEVIDLYRKHIPPLTSRNKYHIEIHKELMQPRKAYLGNINNDDIWNNTFRETFLDNEICCLKPEHLIIYLAYSIAEDDFKYKILHLYDIFLIIKKENIDWSFLIEQSIKWKTVKPLLCVLLLLKQHLGIKYHYPIISELASTLNIPDLAERLEYQLNNIFFETVKGYDIKKERITEYCSHYGFWGTFRFACKILFSRRWYTYKYGLESKKYFILYYRMQAIKEVLNEYFKPFVKYKLSSKATSFSKKENKNRVVKDLFQWLKDT